MLHNTNHNMSHNTNIFSSNDIDHMIKLSIGLIDYIDGIIYCKKQDDFLNIITLKQELRSFLLANCKHDIIIDDIDVDAERSQRIHYCSKCFSTF